MWKLGMIIWSVAAPVLMGIFVLIVLTVPALEVYEKQIMIPAVLAGVVAAVPVTYWVTKKIYGLTRE